MSEVDDLLGALSAVLGATSQLGYDLRSAANDVYEGYVWSEVIRVAQSQTPPWIVSYQNAGSGSNDFLFRKGPGAIYSPKPFSYAELRRGSTTLELHIGVRVRGSSDVAHEFDILLLPKAAAEQARLHSTHPNFHSVAMHIECKFYSGDVNLGQGRGLVGLRVDCDIRAHLVSRHGGPPSVRRLLKHHQSTHVHNVFPNDTGPPYLQTCIEAALSRL